MKLLACLIASSLVLTGCGIGEASPQEKRNLYDACLIEWKLQGTLGAPVATIGSGDYYLNLAKRDCVYLLK